MGRLKGPQISVGGGVGPEDEVYEVALENDFDQRDEGSAHQQTCCASCCTIRTGFEGALEAHVGRGMCHTEVRRHSDGW